jgi:hypothetical protein
MSYQIQLRYSGSLVEGNKIALYEISSAIASLQNSITRAYLYQKHGTVHKHARLSAEELKAASFYIDLNAITEGSLRFNFKGTSQLQKAVVDKITSALNHAWTEITQEGIDFGRTITKDYDTRLLTLRNEIIKPVTFQNFVDSDSNKVIRNYGERSVSKEFDIILSPVREGNATIDIKLVGSRTSTFPFDQNKAALFHKMVSQRQLGPAVIFKVKVRRLDLNKKAVVINTETKKSCTLHFHTIEAFNAIKESFSPDDYLEFIGCPVIEYGSFDPKGGDIYFIEAIKKDAA